MLNIDRSSNDLFNRYKMPRLETKVEGRGNGIKTVLCNMPEVARSLNRPPTYPTKFLGWILGAQTIMKDNLRFVVNGQHDGPKLQNLLYDFIEKYVLCSKCRNPETVLEVKKSGISLHCKACGKFTNVEEKKDRAYTFIKNHPPVDVIEPYGKDKRSENSETTESDLSSANASRTTEASKKIPEVAESEFYQTGVVEAEDENEEFSKYFSSLPSKSATPDEKWSVDVGDTTMQKLRMAELCGGITALTYSEELDLPMSQRMEVFRTYAENQLSPSTFSSSSYQNIFKETTRLELDSRAIGVICEILFVDKDVVVPMIRKHSQLFRMMVGKGKRVEKCLIGVIEALLKKYHDLIARINDIFSLLYDMELVSEGVFIQWYQSDKSDYSSTIFLKKLQSSSKEFIEWLKNAEDEDSSEDDQHEEPQKSVKQPDSLQNGVTSSNPTLVNGKCHPISPVPETVQEELELDIDAI